MPDPEEESNKQIFHPRSSSLTPIEHQISQIKPKQNSKANIGNLKNLKEMRGTMNMPKVENFLPKKEEISPAQTNPRRNTFL